MDFQVLVTIAFVAGAISLGSTMVAVGMIPDMVRGDFKSQVDGIHLALSELGSDVGALEAIGRDHDKRLATLSGNIAKSDSTAKKALDAASEANQRSSDNQVVLDLHIAEVTAKKKPTKAKPKKLRTNWRSGRH